MLLVILCYGLVPSWDLSNPETFGLHMKHIILNGWQSACLCPCIPVCVIVPVCICGCVHKSLGILLVVLLGCYLSRYQGFKHRYGVGAVKASSRVQEMKEEPKNGGSEEIMSPNNNTPGPLGVGKMERGREAGREQVCRCLYVYETW